jgi:hypothetical protein
MGHVVTRDATNPRCTRSSYVVTGTEGAGIKLEHAADVFDGSGCFVSLRAGAGFWITRL